MRIVFCRGREHLKGMEKVCSDSVLVEYISDMHDGDMSELPCQNYTKSDWIEENVNIAMRQSYKTNANAASCR